MLEVHIKERIQSITEKDPRVFSSLEYRILTTGLIQESFQYGGHYQAWSSSYRFRSGRGISVLDLARRAASLTKRVRAIPSQQTTAPILAWNDR